MRAFSVQVALGPRFIKRVVLKPSFSVGDRSVRYRVLTVGRKQP